MEERKRDSATTEGKELEEQGREHRCLICATSFASAQALGGHKKAHRQEKEDAKTLTLPGRRMYFFVPGEGLSFSSSFSSSQAQLFSHGYPSSRGEEDTSYELDLTLHL